MWFFSERIKLVGHYSSVTSISEFTAVTALNIPSKKYSDLLTIYRYHVTVVTYHDISLTVEGYNV